MELRKSKWLLSLVVAGGLFCGTASFAAQEQAQGVSLDDMINTAIAAIDDPSMKKAACQKGALLKGVVSLRAGEGKFCGTLPGVKNAIGAIAQLICSDYVDGSDKFKGSKCDNAYKGDRATPANEIKAAMSNALVQKIFCDPSRSFAGGGVFEKIAKACPASK
jgi:hypothetical protein